MFQKNKIIKVTKNDKDIQKISKKTQINKRDTEEKVEVEAIATNIKGEGGKKVEVMIEDKEGEVDLGQGQGQEEKEEKDKIIIQRVVIIIK